MRHQTLLFLVISLIAVTWMTGCSTPTETALPTYGGHPQGDQDPDPGSVTGVAAGNRAPAFSLADSYGNTLSLADMADKPVLLFFWSENCPYCRQQFANIQSIEEEYGQQMHVVGINLGDTPTTINAVRSEHGLTFPCLVCTAEVQEAYKIFLIPKAIIIGADGIVTFNDHAARVTDSVLQDYLP